MSKKKLGLKIPTKNELLKKYGDMIISANETRESGLWLPSTFFALNHTFGGGIPYGKILEIAGEESSGKALTLDTPILTEQGWKPMGELTLTDKVMDPVSGHSVDIMGIFPQGEKDIYKVTFNDGTSIKCSKDHLWEVQYKVRTETKTEVLSLAQIMNNDIDGKKKKKVSFGFSIPNPTPVRYAANKELPVPPYVLGCILSNVADIGYQNKVVTKLDEFHEVFNMVYFERRLGITISDLGLYVVHENNVPVMRHLFVINDFTSQLASIGVSNEHRAIPRMYLEAPVKDRKILLAGLLDIKGEVTKIGFSYTGNTELVTTMLELIRSLGGWAKITGSEGDTTTIEARMPHFEPFVHKFKREEFRVSTDFECMKKIEKIEYVGKEECQCIKVNSERGLFIANDYIVTHNTLMAYNFAYSCQQLGGSVIWVDAEQSWMNSWARENGVDPDKVTLINDTRIEYIADAVADIALYLRSQLTHNEPILLVVDSIAAMDCTDNVDSNLVGAKAEMGGRAKALYKYFRVRNELFYKLGITQIYINQLRTALNVGFGKENSTTTGGAALKFYASIRAAFYSGKTLTMKIKGNERKVGKLVTIRLIKNKVAPPRPTISKCPVYFNPKYHEIGFDRCYALDDALVELDVLEKTTGGFKYEGKNIARGEDSLRELLNEDAGIRRKLLKASGINTISATRKKMESIQENLYPVEEGMGYESFSESDDDEEEIV